MSAPARLALLGDVHGNLPAFAWALASLARMGLAEGALTGDLVTRGLEPEGCVARARLLRWPCVRGNTDDRVARVDASGGGEAAPGTRRWTRARLSLGSLAFLAGLPDVVELRLGSARVLVWHGRPGSPFPEILPDASDAELEAVAARHRADVIVTGHTHVQVVRRVAGTLFVNPGSVGEAPPGDDRPAWAWLEAASAGPVAHLERGPAGLAPPRATRPRAAPAPRPPA